MDPWLLTLLVFLAYGAALIILGQTGLFRRANIQVVGPLLIWRTGKARALLDRIARFTRAWGLFSRFSVYFVFFTMFATVGLVLWQAYIVSTVRTAPVNPQYAIGIPGINPIIPVGYGIVGLAVAIVVHEGCHGVIARAEKIKVKSVGLMMLIVPIGAFVEPDETEMRAAPIERRQRIFAVGPSSNIVLALLCAWIFSAGFMGSIHLAQEGLVIEGTVPGGPAELAGIQPYTLLTAMVNVSDSSGEFRTAAIVPISGRVPFEAFMANATPGQNVTLSLWRDGAAFSRTLALGARPQAEVDLGASRSVVGIFVEQLPLTQAARPGELARQQCSDRGYGIGSRCYATVVATYIGMPVRGLSPIPPQVAALYTPTGPLAALGGAFWVLADLFYWLFWLNFMVGIFNALPMLPLDGGHMFKDAMLSLLRKREAKAGAAVETDEAKAARKKEEEARPLSPADDLFGTPRRLLDPLERRAHTLTMYTSLFVLTLILWQFVAPSLGPAWGL